MLRFLDFALKGHEKKREIKTCAYSFTIKNGDRVRSGKTEESWREIDGVWLPTYCRLIRSEDSTPVESLLRLENIRVEQGGHSPRGRLAHRALITGRPPAGWRRRSRTARVSGARKARRAPALIVSE